MLKTRSFALDVKAAGDKGEFEGYASVFDVIDSYREVVAPGAFTESLAAWKAKGRLPPILWQHSSRDPLGPFTAMEQDAKGLRVTGQLLVGSVPKAKEAHALLKSGAIQGMSIGYGIPDGGEEYDSAAGVLVLRKVDLWEASLVTFPANQSAGVTSIKSMTARDIEAALRARMGLSAREARKFMAAGLSGLTGQARTPDTSAELAAIAADLRKTAQLFKR